jgi:osmotically-inducible protein OsmY
VDTHENLVTLSGAVSSPEQVARAVNIAYNTEGVRKVVSTLQVKAAAH